MPATLARFTIHCTLESKALALHRGKGDEILYFGIAFPFFHAYYPYSLWFFPISIYASVYIFALKIMYDI